MKILLCAAILIFASALVFLFYSNSVSEPFGCLTGAFISDNPTREDIKNFKKSYGKKPFFLMVFAGWGDLVKEEIIKDVYAEGCVLMVTWEPWDIVTQKSIDYDKVFSGEYDSYIAAFAKRMKNSNGQILIRFAHEANGDWYPWCGMKIGKEKYVSLYRYVKDRFDAAGVKDVKWVFSVNWEDIPKEGNSFISYYPGDQYVDFIGIDGYNWGNIKSWSKWRSFKEIFEDRLNAIGKVFDKPIIISEFGSTSNGGNKTLWIKEALLYIRTRKDIRAFVLFNVNKETDWGFSSDTKWGRELESQLRDSYFVDSDDLPR